MREEVKACLDTTDEKVVKMVHAKLEVATEEEEIEKCPPVLST